jgi:hypothetical protein
MTPHNRATAPGQHRDASSPAGTREALLKARAGAAGISLHRLPDGQWLASRWSLTRELSDAEIEAWLTTVTGSRA